MPSPGPDDRRRSDRADVKIPIDYSSVDAFFSEFSSNINEGGMFIETDSPVPIDARVELEFRLPDATEPLQVAARVAWVSDGKDGSPPGVGLEFQDLSSASRSRINEIVKGLRS